MTEAPLCRLVPKTSAAEFFEVTPSAIDGWIRRGCPVAVTGGKGRPWALDLLEVARWRFAGQGSRQADPDALSPMDRRHWYDGEARRLQLAERAERLVERDDLQTATCSAVRTLADELRTFPALLAAKGHAPRVVQAVAEDIEAGLEALRARLAPFTGDEP